MTHDDALVEAVKRDYRQAPLDQRSRAMLDFAIEVTEDPHTVDHERIAALRLAGLGDDNILDVVQVTGFFNYYNRMVDALGVEPEDFMARPPEPHRPARARSGSR